MTGSSKFYWNMSITGCLFGYIFVDDMYLSLLRLIL
jgi:hypothetical protein